MIGDDRCHYCQSSRTGFVRENKINRFKRKIGELQQPICSICFSIAMKHGCAPIVRSCANVSRSEIAETQRIFESGEYEGKTDFLSAILAKTSDEGDAIERRMAQLFAAMEQCNERLVLVKKWKLDIQQRWGYALWSRYERRRAEADYVISGTALRLMIFARDEFKCRHCGSPHKLSIDHIVSVRKGGSDDPSNLQTLCLPCNSAKGTKPVIATG